MPWTSIIMFVISFLLSKSQGASTGKAAAIGAAAGLATYYIADPANPDNLLGIGGGAKTTPGDVGEDNGASPPSNGGGATAAQAIGGVVQTGLSEAGQTARSWGPTGTLAVATGATLLSDKKWLPWVAGGVLVLLLMSR